MVDIFSDADVEEEAIDDYDTDELGKMFVRSIGISIRK